MKFTNFIRNPVRRLLKANESPTYQHFLDVFHSAMEAPNDEFKAFVITLYTDYRKDGPTSTLTMLELLDQFDVEYTRLANLGHWVKKEDNTMLALLSSLQSLQSKFTALHSDYIALQAQNQNNTKNNRQKLNKPPPKKENDPEVIEFEGFQWKWCNKCFNGSWNRTHVTAEHQPGKGRSRNHQRQPPENSSALLASSSSNTTDSTASHLANIATSQPITESIPSVSNSILLDFM